MERIRGKRPDSSSSRVLPFYLRVAIVPFGLREEKNAAHNLGIEWVYDRTRTHAALTEEDPYARFR